MDAKWVSKCIDGQEKEGERRSNRKRKRPTEHRHKNHPDGGGIDFDEFIELLVNHGRNLEDDIDKSFRMFDLDGDGQCY